MTPEYQTHIRIAALGIAARGAIGDREAQAIRAAIGLKGGMADDDNCDAGVFKTVVGDIFGMVLSLYSERLVPAVREVSAEAADMMERELSRVVRECLTDIIGTSIKH
jgi:hypothetical protein